MMASVNKQSLREEFDALKAEFERLSANGKMAAESRALFQALLMLFEVLLAVFMEKRTAKDNRNSSLPSSQTAKEDNTATQPGAKSKGTSQNDVLSGNTRTVETILDHDHTSIATHAHRRSAQNVAENLTMRIDRNTIGN